MILMRSVTVMLLILCLVSAMSIIWIRHQNRVFLPELYARYVVRDDLNIEWRKLLAERTTLTRQVKLKSWARRVGEMQAPEADIVLILKKRPTDWLLLEGWK